MGVDFDNVKTFPSSKKATVNHKMYPSSWDKDNHVDHWSWLVWKPKKPNLL